MAKNLQQRGHVLSFTAPSGGVSSGEFVLIAGALVVALGDATEGEAFEGAVEGVYSGAPSDDVTAFAEFAPLYYDATDGKLYDATDGGTESDAPFVGRCVGAKAASATVCAIKLIPAPIAVINVE